jgi:hypothetical protein
MSHVGIYFACVFAALLAFSTGLILVARARKSEQRPIKPIWAALIVFAAAFAAGGICSIAGKDIHILYWWLLGVPLAAAFIPLVVVITTVCVRFVLSALFSVAHRFQSSRFAHMGFRRRWRLPPAADADRSIE